MKQCQSLRNLSIELGFEFILVLSLFTSRLGVPGSKYFFWCRDTSLQVPSRRGRLCMWRGTLGGRHVLCSYLDLSSSHLLSSYLGPALLGVLWVLEQQLECGPAFICFPVPVGKQSGQNTSKTVALSALQGAQT